MVLGFVQKFLPDFAATDITWIRSMKSSKFAVLNVQCRDVPIATRVKSTFAALVKSANKLLISGTCPSHSPIPWVQEFESLSCEQCRRGRRRRILTLLVLCQPSLQDLFYVSAERIKVQDSCLSLMPLQDSVIC